MKKAFRLFSIVMLLVLLVIPSTILAKPATDQKVNKDYAPNQIIVKFKNGTSAKSIQSVHASEKAQVVSKGKSGFEVVKFDNKKSVDQMLKEYQNNPNVEYVEPNYYFHATWTPNDPSFSTKQYGPQKMQAQQAWDVTKSSSTVKIAVIDTGVEASHPDLSGKVINGYDFVQRDNVPQDGNGHGTHVAGIAAAATNNGIGMAGMAPNAKILAVRVLDNRGSGTLDNVANGIIYAADQGAQVINLSLGGASGTTTLKNAVDYAWNKGAVVVAAAGNESTSAPSYPAYYNNAIAVASTDSADRMSYFSNYGSWVDVAAPGSDIYSTYLRGGYSSLSGTSMASPGVAGVAALLAAQGKNNVQIRAAIEKSADKISGTGTYWTHGRVNAYKAVTY
ncbi:S8 family peptidase [Hazenella coriacea]|uniref:Thermitase n=1 Tax=Hazenella coriacea TaxID=1179467 RepID=A0A4V6NZB0_9BACL|nr:S8 family peptidase [Hazenella coriacea]TCS96677.1 thermitase [Hazenella coriacea]